MSNKFIYRSLCLAIAVLCGAGGTVFAHPMWGIAVDKAGQVYFSDLTTVWRIDAAGTLSVFRPKGEGHVHEINLDADGNLLGAENTYDPATKKFFSALWKMTPSREASYVVPLQEAPPKGTSIWRDGGDAFYVTEFPTGKLLVLKRMPSGEVRAVIGDEAAVRDFRQSVPYGIGPVAFGANGDVFFTHGASVSKVSREGRLTALVHTLSKEIGSKKRERTSLYGIALEPKGAPIVADYGNRRIFRIGADTRVTTLARSGGPWYPTGVATHGDDVYILEVGHTSSHEPVGTRVRRLSPGGRVTVLATVDAGSAANAPSVPESQPDAPLRLINETREVKDSGRNSDYLLYVTLAVLGLVLSVVILRRAEERK